MSIPNMAITSIKIIFLHPGVTPILLEYNFPLCTKIYQITEAIQNSMQIPGPLLLVLYDGDSAATQIGPKCDDLEGLGAG